MAVVATDESEKDHVEAERFVEEEGVWRHPTGFSRFVVPAVAVAWSLFQLAIACNLSIPLGGRRIQLGLILDSITIRSIHLAFALAMVYLSRPLFRRVRFGLKILALRDRIPLYDVALAVLGALAAVYCILDYEGITSRYGDPILRDILIGLGLMILLLEGCRRAIGPALSIIAMFFCAYAFLGPYMPGIMASKGVSIRRFIGQMTMSTEGIYGVPLLVSANIVFLFVLFGAMLERAGAGHFFTRLALSLLGGFRGGPAKAAVLASGLTGMVSGSSIANIVTTGTFTIPLMKRVGYPPKKAAAIEVAASTDGQLAPPIMGAAAFIIAEYVNVPYVEVIKAAAIPAFSSSVALLYLTHLEACKLGLRGIPRPHLPRFFATLLGGIHFLVPVGFLLYQLIVMRRTPEAAAFAACCVMALVMLFQHPVGAFFRKQSVAGAFRRGAGDILAALAAGGRNMIIVALATAGAGVIVGVVSMGLGGIITEVIDTISMGNIMLMLIVTALGSLIIGMGLPTTATYITMATLMAPVIVALGQSHHLVIPLMAAHLFVFYFGILADDTPPVGLAAYAAAAIAKSPPIATGVQAFLYDVRTAIIPFMFIFNSDIILHGVYSWPQGLLIFAMTCVGTSAFVSATQGWFATRNRWYDIPFLLLATFVLMRPDATARWIGLTHEQRYWTCLLGLALLLALYLLQKWRGGRKERSETPAK